MNEINEEAVAKVVKEFEKFRGVTPQQVRDIVKRYLNLPHKPISETDQDVWWAYSKLSFRDAAQN